MGITSGSEILASDWNSYVRVLTRKTIYTISIFDSLGPNNSASGTGEFWVRSAGWDWGNMYATDRTYSGLVIGSKLAYEVSGQIIQYEAQVADPDMPPASFIGSGWEIVRREYAATDSYVLGDEVVYGGGLFTVKVAGPITATPPILPKYNNLANTDANYDRSSVDNTRVYINPTSETNSLSITLLRPGFSEIEVFNENRLSVTTDTNIWLSPGEYRYNWSYTDELGPVFNTYKSELYTQVYDDNVQQYEELRVLNTSLSDLQAKGSFKLDASAVKSSPRLTGASLIKKGGTSSLYTGDW